MARRRVLVATVLAALLQSTYSLSISAPSSKSGASSQLQANNTNTITRSLPPTTPGSFAGSSMSPTTLPPLVTTISLNNYIDSLAQQQQQQQQQAPAPSQQKQAQAQQNESPSVKVSSAGEPRSSTGEEHDDGTLATTINNHSRNNQNSGRPPQYVDVSALVGRNMSSQAPNGQTSAASVGGAGAGFGAAGLSGKSRSGLPECATQQVCNAIFVRMNYTQRLCECSANYNWKCSHQLDPQDGHTIELTRKFDKRIYTQIKTCEPLREVRACKSPQDWTLLALQSERSGKAHYVVVCKCPTWAQLEGPYTHNHPPYANIPGIRVYGMLCSHQTARSNTAQSYATYNPALGIYPDFPWQEALNVLNTTNLLPTLNSH